MRYLALWDLYWTWPIPCGPTKQAYGELQMAGSWDFLQSHCIYVCFTE